MVPILILETAWWVIVLELIALGILTAITVAERPLSGLAFFIATFIGLSFLQGINPFVFVASNGGAIASYLVVYLLIGIAYSYVKWTWFYLPSDEVQRKIEYDFNYFKRDLPSTVTYTEEEMIDLFAKSSAYPFSLKKDKWRIATWALWWPLNLIWTLFDDVFFKVINWFGSVLSGSFAAIARNQVRKTLQAKKK